MNSFYRPSVSGLLDSANHLIASAAASTKEEDGWSPTVILGHVSDVDEQVWQVRIDSMVQASREESTPPSFAWWEPDPKETQAKYGTSSHEAAATRLLSTRSKIVETLNSLNEEDWQASALHATFGKITVSKCVELILNHDEEHLASFS